MGLLDRVRQRNEEWINRELGLAFAAGDIDKIKRLQAVKLG